MYNQLKPVAKALTKLQQDNSQCCFDACEIYLEFLQNEELNSHFSKVKFSFDKITTTLSIFGTPDESKNIKVKSYHKIRRPLLMHIGRF